MKKKNYSGFYYPSDEGFWSWDWPWNIYGGLKNWFYHKWSSINPNKTNRWDGILIFGFKKITRTWIVSPEKALQEYHDGHKRLVNHLLDLIQNPEKYGLDKDDDIEETRLFK